MEQEVFCCRFISCVIRRGHYNDPFIITVHADRFPLRVADGDDTERFHFRGDIKNI